MEDINIEFTQVFKSGVQYNETDFANFISAGYGDMYINQKVKSVAPTTIVWDYIIIAQSGFVTMIENVTLNITEEILERMDIGCIINTDEDDTSTVTVVGYQVGETEPEGFIPIGMYGKDEDSNLVYTTRRQYELGIETTEYMGPDYLTMLNVEEGQSIQFPRPIHTYKNIRFLMGDTEDGSQDILVEMLVPDITPIGMTIRNVVTLHPVKNSELAKDWITPIVVCRVTGADTLLIEYNKGLRHHYYYKSPNPPHREDLIYTIYEVQAFRY